MTYIPKYICSRSLRQLLEKEYPEACKNPSLWRLLGYNLFGGFSDKDSGETIISRRILAAIEGYKGNLKNYSGRRLLNRFKELEPSFKWRRPDAESRKARRVSKFHPPRIICEALEKESENLRSDIPVFYDDGTQVNRAAKARLHLSAKEKAEEIIAQGNWHPHTMLALKYLNSVSLRTFTALIPNIKDAYPLTDKISNLRSRRRQRLALAAIQFQPKPFYAPSREGRTERLFALGLNLTSLKSEIRRVLTRDWIEADLQNSQLAICAEDWNIPMVKDFLKLDQSVWSYLLAELNVPEEDWDGTKKAFKSALYSILFGMSENSLKYNLTKDLWKEGIPENRSQLFQIPLIRALLKARDEKIQQITEAGGGITCFGKELAIGGDVDSRSILAQIAQAKEFSIVSPIFDLANQTNDFTIALWQHDGFSIKINRQDRRERTIQRIKEFMCNVINKSGCLTELILKNPI